jgi:chemotaxis protein MotB
MSAHTNHPTNDRAPDSSNESMPSPHEPTSAPPAQRTGPITLREHEFFLTEEVSGGDIPRPVTMAAPMPRRGDEGDIIVKTSTPAWIVTAIVIAIAGFVASVLYLELRAERLERATSNQENAAAIARAEEKARDEVGRARADAAEKDVRIKLLERDVGTLAEEKAAQEKELARLKAMEEQLRERVSSEIIAGDIRLIQRGSRLSVDVTDKLLFASGEAEVSARGQDVLSKIGAVLATLDDRNIHVVGHTDDAPPSSKIRETFPSNWELSVARATHVVRFLQDKAKVPGKRLVAVGRGQHEPIASNANGKGRARNRRIEILLTPLESVVAPPRR